ncbi:MAG: hypothetical protein GXX91_04460 [Verrucomicrobiaceae bacterium]|nr:hypothetical protein [Verrucomicrobiaceae bacterium]
MIRGLLLALFCIGTVHAEDKAAPAPASSPANDQPATEAPNPLRGLIDTLDQSAMQEAFRLLTKDYIHHDKLDDLEVNRSALQGMLNRLDFGAMLLTEKSRSERNSPFAFHHARINPGIGYIRFGRYVEDELEKLDAALSEFNAADGPAHLILDLRSPQPLAEFSIASRILSRFRSPNELLFKIRRPGNDRPSLFVSSAVPTSWRKDTVLLVDGETGNVGEIIAAVLKRETGCLILGEKTPGLAVEYRDVPVGEDRILRYAIAEVVLEDDSSIFQKGITPDIVTLTPPRTKHEIYRATADGTALSSYLYQKQRPRMNEAALVAGTDPEIDYYLLLSQRKPTPWDKPPLQDRVLQQAVDLLETTNFLNPRRNEER